MNLTSSKLEQKCGHVHFSQALIDEVDEMEMEMEMEMAALRPQPSILGGNQPDNKQ